MAQDGRIARYTAGEYIATAVEGNGERIDGHYAMLTVGGRTVTTIAGCASWERARMCAWDLLAEYAPGKPVVNIS